VTFPDSYCHVGMDTAEFTANIMNDKLRFVLMNYTDLKAEG